SGGPPARRARAAARIPAFPLLGVTGAALRRQRPALDLPGDTAFEAAAAGAVLGGEGGRVRLALVEAGLRRVLLGDDRADEHRLPHARSNAPPGVRLVTSRAGGGRRSPPSGAR